MNWKNRYQINEETDVGLMIHWACPLEKLNYYQKYSALLLICMVGIYAAAMLQNCDCNRFVWTGLPALLAALSQFYQCAGHYQLRASTGENNASWFYAMHDRIFIGGFFTCSLMAAATTACLIRILLLGPASGVLSTLLYLCTGCISAFLTWRFHQLPYSTQPSSQLT